MLVIIILGILFLWLILDMYEIATTSKHIFTKEELEQMAKEQCGKSKKEAVKLLRKYRQ